MTRLMQHLGHAYGQKLETSFEDRFAHSPGSADLRSRVDVPYLPRHVRTNPAAGDVLITGRPFRVMYAEATDLTHRALEQATNRDVGLADTPSDEIALPRLRVSVQTVTAIGELGSLTLWQRVVAYALKLVFSLPVVRERLLTARVQKQLENREMLTQRRPMVAAARLEACLGHGSASRDAIDLAMDQLWTAHDEYLCCRSLDSSDVMQRMRDGGWRDGRDRILAHIEAALFGRTEDRICGQRVVEVPVSRKAFRQGYPDIKSSLRFVSIPPGVSHVAYPGELDVGEQMVRGHAGEEIPAFRMVDLSQERPIRLRDTRGDVPEERLFLYKGRVIVGQGFDDTMHFPSGIENAKGAVIRMWPEIVRTEEDAARTLLEAAVNDQMNRILQAIRCSAADRRPGPQLVAHHQAISAYGWERAESATELNLLTASYDPNVERIHEHSAVRAYVFDHVTADARLREGLTPAQVATIREAYINAQG